METIEELKKQIAELEKEIELKNHTIEFLESQRDNAYKDYRELKKTIKQTQLDWVQADKNLELAKNYVKDLQEENAKTRKWLDDYGFKTLEEFDKYIEELCIDGKDLVRENAELSTENDNLKERLKNVYCPEYKLGEEKWYIEPNPYCDGELQVFYGKICEICIDATNDDKSVLYKLDNGYSLIFEEEIFDSEAEAQKYLEGLKK